MAVVVVVFVVLVAEELEVLENLKDPHNLIQFPP